MANHTLTQQSISHHPSMKFTDSHCHVDFSAFSDSRPDLLRNCQSVGIHQLLVPSVSPSNWQNVLHLSSLSTPQLALLPALGIHPWYLADLNDLALEQLSDVVHVNRNKIVAIGETGIDGKIAEEYDNLTQQQHFFDYHLQLANAEQLPLIIHHRKSHHTLLACMKRTAPKYGGVVHAFSGSYQQAKQYLDLGLHLGIGGTISYERAKKTINTVRKLPLTSIVLETDAPAMPLHGFQGEANSPLRLINVFDLLVGIRAESALEIAQQIELNVTALLRRHHPKTLP